MPRHIYKDERRTGRTRAFAVVFAVLVGGLVFGLGSNSRANGGCAQTFGGGTGTSADPYLVATAAHLVAIDNTNCLDDYYLQTANIAVSGAWTPIGSASTGFVGHYDGGIYSITGLELAGSDAGLFQVGVAGATFVSLDISVSTSATATSSVGALVGRALGPLTIIGVNVSGNVSGTTFLGGLVGEAGSTVDVLGSSVTGDVSGTGWAGGVVGLATGAVTIASTAVVGNVSATGSSFVGGVVGSAGSSVDVSGSSVTGDVSGTGSYAGGLVGSATGAVTVGTTSVAGNVSSTGGSYVGGLVGQSGALTVSGSSVTGDVSSSAGGYAGGVLGVAFGSPVSISATSFQGDVSARLSFVGGLVGQSGALTVSGSSVRGDVSSTTGGNVGGILGVAFGQAVSITNDYVVGNVSGGDSYVGGLVGQSGALTVSGSSMSGSVASAGSYAGGLLGATFGDAVGVSTSAVVADVSATGTTAGGFAGQVGTGSIIDAFYRGVLVASGLVGGAVGAAGGNVSLTRVYVAGSRPSPAVTDQSGFVGQQGGSLGVTNSFCTGLDCSLRALDTDLKSQSFLEGFGWDFDTVWCVSSSTNGGYPVLRAITFPAAGFAPCWTPVVVVAPSLPMTPIWRVALDPNDGECREGTTVRNERWVSVFVGYRYLPGEDDCERDEFTFEGWADADQPDEVLRLPMLVDPTDGVRRAFLASNADLVAVWKEVDETDVELDDLTGTAPGAFVGGPDRPTREGGGVVDGYYIPPGTVFGPWMLAK